MKYPTLKQIIKNQSTWYPDNKKIKYYESGSAITLERKEDFGIKIFWWIAFNVAKVIIKIRAL